MNQISENNAAILNNTDQIKEHADDINDNTKQIEKNEVRLIKKARIRSWCYNLS